VLVGAVRQTIRSSTITVNGAEISGCIQAWTRGEPWTPASVPAPPPGVVDAEATPDEWAFPASAKAKSSKLPRKR
jgi:hypothetical protein